MARGDLGKPKFEADLAEAILNECAAEAADVLKEFGSAHYKHLMRIAIERSREMAALAAQMPETPHRRCIREMSRLYEIIELLGKRVILKNCDIAELKKELADQTKPD